MTTITWKITTLDRRISDGFVTTAHWTCSGVDGDFTGSVYATCSWSEGKAVVPYDSLTEQQVLTWVWESGVDKAATEAAVAAQIEAQKNPVNGSGLPWTTPAAE